MKYEGLNVIIPANYGWSYDVFPVVRIDNDRVTLRISIAWLLWGIELYWSKR